MTDQPMKLAPDRLKLLRESRGWTQEQLAEVAGLSARTVQRIEAAGKAAPETGMALASALGCPLSELSGHSVPQVLAGSPAPGAAGANRLPARIALGAIVLVMIVIVFGYRIGKDMAERDNQGHCRASSGTECR